MKNKEVIVTVHSTEELQAVDRKVFRYTAEPVVKKYIEDFLDNDTGEVVSCERNELIFERGRALSPDDFSILLFHLQCEDVTEVKLSDVQRRGNVVGGCHFRLWAVKACGIKKLKMLLRADNALLAYEVAKDYIELNYEGTFTIEGIKTYNDCYVIEPEKDDGKRNISADRWWYIVEVESLQQDPGVEPVSLGTGRFVVFAENVESANAIIGRYMAENKAKKGETVNNVILRTKSASVISCNVVVPAEFCFAYTKRNEENQ
ncbi:MAG: hypothetical protein IJK84_10830 [Bacteroidales bacterium]|nr:hypothetical protein [Bacteroidales bacterium]MBQ7512652.1 hypothetical protein [Prevotella sp.]